ncbi:hypothetical protein GCM10011506_12820 [Marivirga lumbricoides]|uniref:Secretion system C-terminal sorting domain-containing protein n=1 Tax=Marivirga lumbricoides TaxID=1046115 RepID=A0ABQ1LSV7_9BACT|nr:hypothetical protein GCM10011506_12820 [Marivirga lumbricoides]
MKWKLILCIFSFLAFHQSKASHLLGGYIHSEWISGNLYEITVYLFVDSKSDVGAASGILSFGDGTSLQAPFNSKTKEISEGFNLVSFVVAHTYSGSGTYTISYSEEFYNNGIINFQNSNSIPLYFSSSLLVSPVSRTNSSPLLKLTTIQRGLKGIIQRTNPVAYDADDDSLSYELIIPEQSNSSPIISYRYPNDSLFYINFSRGNQEKNGKPEYSISPITGEIIWDAPDLLGEYAIAYKIIQWRKLGGDWQNIGENQVILIDKIVDADKEIDISTSDLNCYETASQIDKQLIIENNGSTNDTLRVFTDLPGLVLNNQIAKENEFTEFQVNGPFTLSVRLPDSVAFTSFKPYRVILSISTPYQTVTSSWAFALGCEELPENISPDPIIREEKPNCEEMVIYPNPSNHRQYLQVCLPSISETNSVVRIIDLKGRKLLEQDITQSTSQLTLDVSYLKPGFYFLQVGKMSAKFVVE